MDSKNNKSPGVDQINVEIIKYSPEVMYEKPQIYTIILQPQGSSQMKLRTEF